MVIQNWKGEALENLQNTLFRPNAGVFVPSSGVKQKSTTPRTLYSPGAKGFLEEKEPASTDYFKRLELNKVGENRDAKGKDDAWGRLLGTCPRAKCKPWKSPRGTITEPPRKGELPSDLIKTIWGPTPRQQRGEEEERETAADDFIRKLKRKKVETHSKVVECLMDVLLRSWVYFEHSQENIKSVENHVHAKYCEGFFGHYLLPDGIQIHGSYVISLRQLIRELKGLMANLQAKVIRARYKEVPVWRAPRLDEVREFCLPEQKPMPQLYPIEGLLPLPEDDTPPDSSMPLLQTPQMQRHPHYVRPKSKRKAAVLSLPPLQDFSSEEAGLKKYKEVPPPILKLPQELPLPEWQGPQELPLPPMPINEEAKTLQLPEREVIPPYATARRQALPCEASYYFIEQGKKSICDGLCGRIKGTNRQGEESSCLAIRPRKAVIPSAPITDVIPEPPFVPPPEEPLPPFVPPLLKPEPKYVGPSQSTIPKWSPPSSPDPIGYLAGQKPVFLVDCSATMAGDRIKCAQDAIRSLLSKGGQVEVAASHFDIIMYSFDAWSFGAVEEDRQYKLNGGAPRYWIKNLELMQPTTPENMERALAWMGLWGTGGTSNLKKAIEIAMQRTSADCVYILTHGKCDRPVIIMNALRELQETRLIPIYPIGLEPTKPQARILKNVLADITGGQYRELDLRWQYKAHIESGLASQDTLWLNASIEYWQRKSLAVGTFEPVDSILKRLRQQFDEERISPQMARSRKEEERAKFQHKILLDAVREENCRAVENAQESYRLTHATILKRNKQNLERAQKFWEVEMQNVRATNVQKNKLYAEWLTEATQIEAANKTSEENARRRFTEAVRHIEESYSHSLLHGKEEYQEQVKLLKEKNEMMTRNHKKLQEEMVTKMKAKNEASWKAYEDKCADIKALNAQYLKTAQVEFAASCDAVIKENQRRMMEAEDDHKMRFEAVSQENARRKSEYMTKVNTLEVRKLEARKSHQERVSTLVAQHKASIANELEITLDLEKSAKSAWEEACRLIDQENKNVTDRTYQAWKDATHLVQLENERLAKMRVEFQERKEEVEALNNEIVRKKKEEWKKACRQLEKQYKEDCIGAKVGYDLYVETLLLRNEQLLEAAKVSYDANVAAINAYNQSVRPYVERSEVVQKELDTIRAFLGYIVSQSNLPPEKNAKRKRTLEQSLDMLAALDSPCPPKVIITALQTAYANDIKGRMFPEIPQNDIVNNEDGTPTGMKLRSKFADMVPIQPVRAKSHHCAGGANFEDANFQQKGKSAQAMKGNKQENGASNLRANE